LDPEKLPPKNSEARKSGSKKFRAIIFDIGRVLVSLDIAGAMGELAGTISLTPQETWAAIERDPRWRDWQEGRMSPRDWQLHICRRLGVNLSYEQFSEIWNRVLDPMPLLDGAFLASLSKRYCLAVLSNTDPIHVAELERRSNFFRFFKHRIYSCVVGASKPSPLIFRAALQACKTTADNAIYIDDIPSYAEAARQLGMTGIVFQSPEQLIADLEQLGATIDQKG
jgi:putative hydrolase of the HAD superfamily